MKKLKKQRQKTGSGIQLPCDFKTTSGRQLGNKWKALGVVGVRWKTIGRESGEHTNGNCGRQLQDHIRETNGRQLYNTPKNFGVNWETGGRQLGNHI